MSEARGRRGLLFALGLSALIVLAASGGTRAEVVATHDMIINFDSRITPRVLPRHDLAPVGIEIEGHVNGRKGHAPASLRKIELRIHKAATLFRRGLPTCGASNLDPASTSAVLAACRGAKIGYGRIRAESNFPGQPRFPFDGRALLLNGRLENGSPAILLHVFNKRPRSSFVFPFAISHRGGTYGTVLKASLALSRFSRITDFELVLNRTFRFRGQKRGFFSASCPAPEGFSIGISPFVKATLSFGDGTESRISVVSSCRVAD